MDDFLRDLALKRDAARCRLLEAQRIADQLRHSDQLHRLAMMAVFVLEDCLFALEQTGDELRPKTRRVQPW